MLMRKFFYSLVVLILILLALPFGMGFYVEHTIDKLIAESRLPSYLSVGLQDYQRSWFSSKANFNVQLNIDNEYVLFETPVVIEHGPIIYDGIKKRFKIAQALIDVPVHLTEQNSTQTHQKPLLHLSIIIGLDNSVHVEFSSPSFELLNNNIKMNWKGIMGDISLSPNRKNVELSLQADPLFIQFNQTSFFSTGHFTLKNTSQKHDNQLWFGNVTAKFKDLLYKPTHNTPINMDNLEINIANVDEENTVNTASTITAHQITYDGNHYGPFKLHYNLNHLSTDALIELNQLNQRNAWQANYLLPQQRFAILQATFDLIKPGVSFIIDELSLDTPQGKVTFHGYIELPKIKSLGQLFSELPELTQQIKAQAVLRWPEALESTLSSYNETNNLFVLLQKNHWLKKDGLFYETNFELKKGQAFVNAKEIEDFSIPISVHK